jgi:deazaflavin-dependent oxidoreductase (nitroreductase family)
MTFVRGFFRVLNRLFMVPIFRLGLGSFLVNPFSGYIMVLKMTGHKTGKTRYVPVNYAIDSGRMYFLSGMGKKSHWYSNLAASPVVDALLPDRTVHGDVTEVIDAVERLRMARRILRAAGFAGFFEGFNPFSCSDERLASGIKEMVLFRLQPTGLGAGPSDSGGRAWIMMFLLGIILCLGLYAILAGAIR